MIVNTVVCDWGDKQPAETIRITVPGMGSFEMDACKKHKKEFFGGMRRVKRGRPTKEKEQAA